MDVAEVDGEVDVAGGDDETEVEFDVSVLMECP